MFWFMITSVDNGKSMIVGTPIPCPFHPATKFNLTGLNAFDVDVGFNLNLTIIIWENSLKGIGEVVAHVKVALMIALELVTLYE